MNEPRHWRFWQRPYGYHFGSYAQIQFEPRDLWVGCFWRVERYKGQSDGWDKGRPVGDHFSWPWTLHVYLCLIPMLPLHVSLMRKVPVVAQEGQGEDLGASGARRSGGAS